jgi:hypothetical protein
MRAINQKAGAVFDKLTAGMGKTGDHRKIENGAFMPLSIEVIGQEELQGNKALEISFCHYGTQNGDAMRDPEMCFFKIIGQDGRARYYPSYYRNDYLGIEQFTYIRFESGQIKGVNQFMQKDQALFAAQWACNLKEQGFIEACEALIRNEFVANQIKECQEMRAKGLKEVSSLRELIKPEDLAKMEQAGLIKTPLQIGSSAYNFAKSEGMI